MFDQYFAYRNQSPLTYKLMRYVIFFSAAFTVFATSLQLYVQYRHERGRIQSNITFIKDSYLKPVAVGLFNYDAENLHLQVDGILKLKGIVHLRILDSLTHATYISAGDLNHLHLESRTFNLVHRTVDGEAISVGDMVVTASFENVYQSLRQRLLCTLLFYGVCFLMAAFFISYIIHTLLTRHLITMSQYTRDLNLDTLNTPMELNRPAYGEDDELSGIVNAFNTMRNRLIQDIAQQRRIEHEKRESDERYRSIFENANDAIITTDNLGIISSWNNRAQRLFGYTAQEIKGRHISILYPEEERRDQAHLLELAATGQIIESFEIKGRKKNNDIPPMEITLSLMTDQNDDTIGFTAIIRDISDRKQEEAERKKIEAQLLQAQKMEAIGTLAGGIAHDFNNILGIIIGNIEHSLEYVIKGAKEWSSLKEAEIACLRARELIKQILNFSRKEQPERIAMDMVVLIKESMNLIRATLPATIIVTPDFRIIHAPVLGNPTQISQILLNLCTNAAQAMQYEGRLCIAINRHHVSQKKSAPVKGLIPGDYIRFSVSDTGSGIAPELIDKIFDPYFTTKRVGEGTGLGLSVVYGIVAAHEGTITVESSVGVGTTFHLYFPVHEAAPRTDSIGMDTAEQGNERILFVDDEEMLVEVTERLLEMLGYHLDAYTNPLDALEAFRNHPHAYDLIITDMTMPNLTGDRLAAEARTIRPDIPVIVCTGIGDSMDTEKAKALGIQKYLIKPLRRNRLAGAIRKVMDQSTN